MKIRFFYPLIIICILSSCCGFVKGGCNEANGIYYIYYDNFPKSELDSVYLLKYKKNTNFTELLDSVRIRVDSNNYNRYSLNSDLMSADTNNVLMTANDYKVFIKDIDKTIFISNIIEDETSCRSCPGSIKEKLIGIRSLKQDSVVIEVPENSGFLNQIIIEN